MTSLRFPLGLACILTALTALPYAAGWLRQDGRVFDGVLAFPADSNSYLAYLAQASRGALLFVNPFTSEPHAGALINLEWLLGGWISALAGGEVLIGFHALRVAGIFAFVLLLWKLSALLFDTLAMRRLVTLVIAAGGGFGWLALWPAARSALTGFSLVDGWAGLHPFFSMLLQPHFLCGQVLMAGFLLCALRAERADPPDPRGWRRAGLLAALTGLVRPFDMLAMLAGSALLVFATLVGPGARTGRERRRDAATRAWPLFCAAPVLLYLSWVFGRHEVFRWWSLQNVALPPEPLSLLVSLGPLALLLPVALVRFGHDLRMRSRHAVSLAVLAGGLAATWSWPLVSFGFQVLPALGLPALLVATQGCEAAVTALRRRASGLVLIGSVLALCMVTSVALLWQRTAAAQRGEYRTDAALVSAMRWLGEHAEPGDVVLAAEVNGNRLPRHAPVATVLGYEYATVDVAARRREVAAVFLPLVDDSVRRALLQRQRVRWVLFGDEERALGGWQPERAAWLSKAHEHGAVSVWRVHD